MHLDRLGFNNCLTPKSCRSIDMTAEISFLFEDMMIFKLSPEIMRDLMTVKFVESSKIN